MALGTGDLSFYYPLVWPTVTGLTTAIGGGIDTGNSYLFATTGSFPTGQSNLPGAGSETMYAKIFVRHEGVSGETLSNPMLYISNSDISDQLTIAPDPYWTGGHAAQTGQAANRLTIPGSLATGDFVNYLASSPMDLSTLSGNTVTIDSGESIGIWIKRSIPAGLSAGKTNTFNLILRGEV